MGHGPRPARATLHLLQQMSAQRAVESDGLLRARTLPEPRRHDRRVDDNLRDTPDTQPAAGCPGEGCLGRSAVTAEPPVTHVKVQLRRLRRLLLPVLNLLALVLVIGLIAVGRNRTEVFPDITV